ncbi:hypothetical protein HDV63DRAFT_26972 [Trichoderma sp. SZMC 28014]
MSYSKSVVDQRPQSRRNGSICPGADNCRTGPYRGLSEQSGKSTGAWHRTWCQSQCIGTLTGIDRSIAQPPFRLSAESQAEALSRMRCPPSGSRLLNGSSSGRLAESSRRAPCWWDTGGNCVSGAGYLIIEIADGNYHSSTLYLAWTGRKEDPACAVFHRFCPWAMSWPWPLSRARDAARLTAGSGPNACRLPAGHRDSFAALYSSLVSLCRSVCNRLRDARG